MKHFPKLKQLLVAFLCLSSLFTMAQQGDTLEIQRNEKGSVAFARFKPNANRKIHDGASFLKAMLHAKPDDEFRLQKDVTDEFGISHRKYQQYYKGTKVENAEYLVHGKNGTIETVNGDFQDVNIPSVAPSISEKEALSKALIFVHAQKYKWEDKGMENFVKQNTNNPKATYYPQGELVITRDFLKGGNNLRLAWRFTISSLQPDNEQLIYVDASTGDVIRTTPLICNINTPCTAQTRYSGTVGITGDSFTGGFRLREDRNNVNVQTLNLQGTSNVANAVDFTNTNTSFTSGSWANFNQDRAALDAHWGAEKVLDYWGTVHNRNSIDGNGITVSSYVHYLSGENNAFWVGGVNGRYMLYGDGDGVTFNPLTALDVCAHEFGHGITEFTSQLTPGTEESGALNEGFSDIWAACVAHWAAPEKNPWLIGEEIFATSTFTCIRDLSNPNNSKASEGRHPDTYKKDFWDASGEPHFNSTVLSHWFYLISQGDIGTNDLGNAFTVQGIGINDAQLIAFRAESVYLTSSANYAAARNATIQAARDIFGVNSCQEILVTNAWYAVGVGAAYPISSYTISGPNVICSSANYAVSGLPAGATVTWSASSGNVSLAPNGTQVTVTGLLDGNVDINATVTLPCGQSVPASSKYVRVGNYTTPYFYIYGPTYVSNGQLVQYWVPNYPNVYYEWTFTDHFDYAYGQYTPTIALRTKDYFYSPSPASVTVTFHDVCSDNTSTLYVIVPSYGYYSVSPNPATSEIKVETTTPLQEDAEVQLVGLYTGQKVYSKKLMKGSKQILLKVGHLKRGQYVLVVKDKTGKTISSKQVVLK